MELTYYHDPVNPDPEKQQVRFHELGDLCLSQSRQADPAGPETPQRATVTLRVRVEIFCGSYGEGYAKVKAIQEAVKAQNAVLEWRNPADPNPVYLNQTVVAASCEAPEEWGTYHQVVNVTFVYVEALTAAQAGNIAATLAYGNPPTTVRLGNVVRWQERYQARRFNELRSFRERGSMTVTASGMILPPDTWDGQDTRVNLGARRAALLDAKNQFMAAARQKEVTLSYGPSVQNKLARIEEASADVNQAVTGLDWSFTAAWTEFPSEGAYETAEFNVVDRETRETGQKVVIFSGVVRSQSLSAATAKLDELRAAVFAQDAYKDAKRVRMRAETRVNYVSANADGGGVPSGFLELGFDEEWMVFTAKSGAISMQYARRTEFDYLQLQKTTTVQGSVFGPAAVLAGIEDGGENNLLDLFLAGYGEAVKREVGVDREWTGAVDGQELRTDAETPQKLEFAVQYIGTIDSGDSILEAQMTESVEYAGTRWVEQPLPDGPSLMQNCGVQAGRRTVSGTVTAGSRQAAEAWANGKRALLFAQRQNPPSLGFEQPPKLDTESVFLPRSGTAVRVYRVSFTFAEVLPDYETD